MIRRRRCAALLLAPILAACQAQPPPGGEPPRANPAQGLQARSGAEPPEVGPWAYRRNPEIVDTHPGVAESEWSRSEPDVFADGVGTTPEAAESDARIHLADRVRGLVVGRRETLGQRLGPDGRTAVLLSITIRDATRVAETPLPGGALVVRLAIPVEQIRTLCRELLRSGSIAITEEEIAALAFRSSEYRTLIHTSENGMALLVAVPGAGSRVETARDSVVVRGTALGPSGAARVYVRNGRTDRSVEASGEDSARFQVAAPLEPGPNDLEVIAVDPAGSEARIALVVIREL